MHSKASIKGRSGEIVFRGMLMVFEDMVQLMAMILLLWKVEEFWSCDCTVTSCVRPTSGEGVRAHHNPQSCGGPKLQ